VASRALADSVCELLPVALAAEPPEAPVVPVHPVAFDARAENVHPHHDSD